jgi:hypothetical protein
MRAMFEGKKRFKEDNLNEEESFGMLWWNWNICPPREDNLNGLECSGETETSVLLETNEEEICCKDLVSWGTLNPGMLPMLELSAAAEFVSKLVLFTCSESGSGLSTGVSEMSL